MSLSWRLESAARLSTIQSSLLFSINTLTILSIIRGEIITRPSVDIAEWKKWNVSTFHRVQHVYRVSRGNARIIVWSFNKRLTGIHVCNANKSERIKTLHSWVRSPRSMHYATSSQTEVQRSAYSRENSINVVDISI